MAVQEAPHGGEPYSQLKKRVFSLLRFSQEASFKGENDFVVALAKTGILKRGFIVQITSSEPTFMPQGTAIYPAERLVVQFPRKKDPVATETTQLMTVNSEGYHVVWTGDTKPDTESTDPGTAGNNKQDTASLDNRPPIFLNEITEILAAIDRRNRLDGFGRTSQERKKEEELIKEYRKQTTHHIHNAKNEKKGIFKQRPGETSIAGFPLYNYVVEYTGPFNTRVVIIDPVKTLFESNLSATVQVYFTPETNDYTEYRIDRNTNRIWYREIPERNLATQSVPATLRQQESLVEIIKHATYKQPGN